MSYPSYGNYSGSYSNGSSNNNNNSGSYGSGGLASSSGYGSYGSSSSSSSGGYGGSSGGGGGYGGSYGGGYGGGGYGSGSNSSGMGANLRKIDWDREDLPKFEKNFYIENHAVSSRSSAQVEAYRQKCDMRVFGQGIPKPVETFDEASFPDYVLTQVKAAGFKNPTAIQSQGWPMALSGRDMVIILFLVFWFFFFFSIEALKLFI